MNSTGKIEKKYTVSFMRVSTSPMQVGDFAEVDIHKMEVKAGNSAGARTKAITFQKEQFNRTIQIRGVVPVEPDEE